MTLTSSNPTNTSYNNSSAETDVSVITIPANSLADGQKLDLSAQIDYLNNSGAGRTLVIKVHFGSAVLTLLNGTKNNSVNPWKLDHEFRLIREGATDTNANIRFILGDKDSNFPSAFVAGQSLNGIDFTVANDLKISTQWSVADANASVTVNASELITRT